MDDIRLIALVKEQPIIYNKMDNSTKNMEIRQKAWTRIVRQLGQEYDEDTLREVKNRWKNLRDSYVKAVKYKNAIANGDDTIPKKITCKYPQALSFLDPYCGHNPAKEISCNESTASDVSENFGTVENSGNKLDKGIFHPETLLVLPLNQVRGDEVDSFFKGIADTVKNFSPENQAKIQKDIVNIVMDMKLKEIQRSRMAGEVVL